MEIEAQFDAFLVCTLFHPSGTYRKVLFDPNNASLDFVYKEMLITLSLLLLLVLLFPFAKHRAGTSSISAHILVVSGVIMHCFDIIQRGNVVPINLFSV